MPMRPPPKADATHAPQPTATAKKPPPSLPPGTTDTAISQAQAESRERRRRALQAKADSPPAFAQKGPPQEEVRVEPHDGADFDPPPSPEAPATPRGSETAEGGSGSAPGEDASSQGAAVPKSAGCQACSLGVCTLHMVDTPRGTKLAEEKSHSAPATDAASEGEAAPKIPASEAPEERPASKAMPSPSMSGCDPPEEGALTNSSGEKPAAQEEPCDEFVCMLIFHGVIDHLFFCLRGGIGLPVDCGRAGGQREVIREVTGRICRREVRLTTGDDRRRGRAGAWGTFGLWAGGGLGGGHSLGFVAFFLW